MTDDIPHNPDSPSSADAREQPFIPFGRRQDWRMWLGFVITMIWLAMLSLYISMRVGWSNIGTTPLDQFGGFLEGAFAPLAFLWFVLAFFSQQKELAQNTTAIKMQYVEIQKSTEQAVIQSEAIRASESHARKESFLRIADSVSTQLGSIMGFLYLSSQGANTSGAVSQKRMSQMWAQMSQNDPEVFSRSMMQIQFSSTERYQYKLYYGTPIRTRHSENFVFNFERLLSAASQCDNDGMIRDALMGSAHGYVYNRMIANRDHPPAGFTYGKYDFDPDTPD